MPPPPPAHTVAAIPVGKPLAIIAEQDAKNMVHLEMHFTMRNPAERIILNRFIGLYPESIAFTNQHDDSGTHCFLILLAGIRIKDDIIKYVKKMEEHLVGDGRPAVSMSAYASRMIDKNFDTVIKALTEMSKTGLIQARLDLADLVQHRKGNKDLVVKEIRETATIEMAGSAAADMVLQILCAKYLSRSVESVSDFGAVRQIGMALAYEGTIETICGVFKPVMGRIGYGKLPQEVIRSSCRVHPPLSARAQVHVLVLTLDPPCSPLKVVDLLEAYNNSTSTSKIVPVKCSYVQRNIASTRADCAKYTNYMETYNSVFLPSKSALVGRVYHTAQYEEVCRVVGQDPSESITYSRLKYTTGYRLQDDDGLYALQDQADGGLAVACGGAGSAVAGGGSSREPADAAEEEGVADTGVEGPADGGGATVEEEEPRDAGEGGEAGEADAGEEADADAGEEADAAGTATEREDERADGERTRKRAAPTTLPGEDGEAPAPPRNAKGKDRAPPPSPAYEPDDGGEGCSASGGGSAAPGADADGTETEEEEEEAASDSDASSAPRRRKAAKRTKTKDTLTYVQQLRTVLALLKARRATAQALRGALRESEIARLLERRVNDDLAAETLIEKSVHSDLFERAVHTLPSRELTRRYLHAVLWSRPGDAKRMIKASVERALARGHGGSVVADAIADIEATWEDVKKMHNYISKHRKNEEEDVNKIMLLTTTEPEETLAAAQAFAKANRMLYGATEALQGRTMSLRRTVPRCVNAAIRDLQETQQAWASEGQPPPPPAGDDRMDTSDDTPPPTGPVLQLRSHTSRTSDFGAVASSPASSHPPVARAFIVTEAPPPQTPPNPPPATVGGGMVTVPAEAYISLQAELIESQGASLEAQRRELELLRGRGS